MLACHLILSLVCSYISMLAFNLILSMVLSNISMLALVIWLQVFSIFILFVLCLHAFSFTIG